MAYGVDSVPAGNRRGTSEAGSAEGSYSKPLQGTDGLVRKTDSAIHTARGDSASWNPINNGGTRTPLGAGNSNPL